MRKRKLGSAGELPGTRRAEERQAEQPPQPAAAQDGGAAGATSERWRDRAAERRAAQDGTGELARERVGLDLAALAAQALRVTDHSRFPAGGASREAAG